MHLLADTAASTPTPYLYLIVLFGSGGILAAILGFFKLRGERDSLAVSQAQGAMETMVDLQEQLEKSLHRANERADYYRRRCEAVDAELEEVQRRWGPFPIDEEHVPPATEGES